MNISKRQANEIIRNLKNVINEDINFISPEGYIIASSDESRVGNYHEGATIVAQSRKMLIINKEYEYEGTRKGINLPIFFENNLIAIVGITGEANEIIQFSNVIKKMSEILIKENFLNVQKEFKRENNRVIMELIVNDKVDSSVLKLKFEELAHQPDKYKFVVIIRFDDLNSFNTEVINMVYNTIEKRLNFEDMIVRIENDFVILSQTENYLDLFEKFNLIKQYVEAKYQVNTSIGISPKIENINQFYNSFLQAKMTIDYNKEDNNYTINQFDRSSLDYLLETINKHVDKTLFSYFFKDIDNNELLEMKKLINSYVKNNGSINAISNELYIHKNTVQYRLNKIYNMIGYDPRRLKDLIGLYIVFKSIN